MAGVAAITAFVRGLVASLDLDAGGGAAFDHEIVGVGVAVRFGDAEAVFGAGGQELDFGEVAAELGWDHFGFFFLHNKGAASVGLRLLSGLFSIWYMEQNLPRAILRILARGPGRSFSGIWGGLEEAEIAWRALATPVFEVGGFDAESGGGGSEEGFLGGIDNDGGVSAPDG